MATTRLSLSGTPGKTYSFTAKEAAPSMAGYMKGVVNIEPLMKGTVNIEPLMKGTVDIKPQ